jgi:hypothetical protein
METFVAYKREDLDRVIPLVRGLREAGISVWWDQDIPGGARWRQTAMDHLDAARCVIVVWSEASVSAAGEFVHDEAASGNRRGVLLPVRIDDVAPPLGFGQLHSLSLIDWAGNSDDPGFANVVSAVKAQIAGEQVPPAHVTRTPVEVVAGGLGRLIGLLTNYGDDLFQFTSAPKQFLAERLARPAPQWAQGLLFLCISYLFTFVLSRSLAPTGKSQLQEFVTDVPYFLLDVALFGYGAYLAWRAVGAKPPVLKFVTVHFYVGGVTQFIKTGAAMAVMGALRLSDPTVADAVQTAIRTGDFAWFHANTDRLLGGAAAPIAALSSVVLVSALGFWVVVAWGAYRNLAGVSNRRSICAFLLFCAFSLLVAIIMFFIALSLLPQPGAPSSTDNLSCCSFLTLSRAVQSSGGSPLGAILTSRGSWAR